MKEIVIQYHFVCTTAGQKHLHTFGVSSIRQLRMSTETSLSSTQLFEIARHAASYPHSEIFGVITNGGTVIPLMHTPLLRPMNIVAANYAMKTATSKDMEIIAAYVVRGEK